jgi:hypothetical protein
MEIHYCAQCGARIAPEDLEAGRATTADGFNFRCERCKLPAGTSLVQAPPAGNRRQSARLASPGSGARRSGTASAASTSREKAVSAKAPAIKARRPLSMPLIGAGVLVLCGLLALAVFALGGSSGVDPDREPASASPRVPSTVSPQLPAPLGPTPPVPPTPAAPVKAAANSETLAQEAFDTLTRFAGLNLDDRAGRIARIQQFLERHGQSQIAPRARVLLNELSKPDNGVRDHTVFIKLNTTVQRTLEQIKTARCAYGPKQEYDAATGETHIYLPYGNNSDLYFGEFRVILEDAHEGRLAELRTPDSGTAALLTYKLQFDKPISACRFRAGGQVELDLEPTCVAGLEYSTDGGQWKPVHEYKGTEITVYKIFGPFIENASVSGLNTQTLFLRYYSRDSANPQATNGKRMWLKLWMTGDPAWGDAATTFFANQSQIWVKEAK